MVEEKLNEQAGSSLSAEKIEDIKAELENIRTILGDSSAVYADTGDSMEFLDTLLGSFGWYKDLLPERKVASQKAMDDDLEDIEAWLQKVESHF